MMKPFPPPTAFQEFVSIDIFAQLLQTPLSNNFLLVITNRCSKLARTIPLKNITAALAAKAFVTNWLLAYGPPKWLLSNNGKKFTARFVQHVCEILVVGAHVAFEIHLG